MCPVNFFTNGAPRKEPACVVICAYVLFISYTMITQMLSAINIYIISVFPGRLSEDVVNGCDFGLFRWNPWLLLENMILITVEIY